MKDRKNLHNWLEVIVPESNYIWTFFYNYYQILNNCLRHINKSLLKKNKKDDLPIITFTNGKESSWLKQHHINLPARGKNAYIQFTSMESCEVG